MEDWEWKPFSNGNSHIRPPPTTATCAFCVKTFRHGDHITRLSCHHYFHRSCILRWLSRHKCCPICLRPTPSPKNSGEAGRGRGVVAVRADHYQRPLCLWFYQLMELIEALLFRDD